MIILNMFTFQISLLLQNYSLVKLLGHMLSTCDIRDGMALYILGKSNLTTTKTILLIFVHAFPSSPR